MTAYLDLTSRVNAMRCDFLDQEEQTHIDKIKQFVSDVKEKITSKDVDQHTVEDTMQKALAFLTQPVPNLTDSEDCEDQELSMLKRLKKKDSEDFQATGDEELSMLKRLKEKDELEQMKQAFVSLQNHCDSLKKDTERLETKVKELESEHKISSYVLDKRMSKIRDFIKRNPRTEDSPQGGSCHGTEHSIQGDSSQGKATIFSSGTNDISDYVTNGTRELTALTVRNVLNIRQAYGKMIYLPSELLVFVSNDSHICIYNCKTFTNLVLELESVECDSCVATKPDSQDEIFLASGLELKVLSVTMDSYKAKRTYVIEKEFCALASLLNGLLVKTCNYSALIQMGI
ncbi:hypothetical protein PoB_004627700 [Plakobranchus ocellatus]|uniref:Uncharacterized protein n=1 Tax=Plakobranchus ocellatus TaxID=259542 RepID=A0AAV4BLH1_9GAST|nr:hypothetical protein PoB_004627700 [Plakobranchus ocellatus]